MKRQKLKISLVGCGRIAKRHAELLIHSLGNEAELISVCDTNFTKLNSKFIFYLIYLLRIKLLQSIRQKLPVHDQNLQGLIVL